jgi:hypothetical protein
MKKYSVAHARERLADVLNEADRGVPVAIERRGVRYVLRAERTIPPRTRRRRSLIDVLDPDVAAGQWTWAWEPGQVQFRARP